MSIANHIRTLAMHHRYSIDLRHLWQIEQRHRYSIGHLW